VKSFRFSYYALAVILFITGCSKKAFVVSSETSYYNINNELPKDSTTIALIKPYADSVNKTMNKVIGYAAIDMPKGKPESLMGNFFCDALLSLSNDYFNTKADVCIMNYGGLRIPVVSKGNITIGKVFELMPFDNFLVLMKVKGEVLQEVLHHVAKEGGWPVAGINMKIKENKAVEIIINNEPLQNNKEYQLLISDYMADGGDNLEMLKNIPYDNSGVFVRDVVIGYIIQQTSAGKNIQPVLENRIQPYAE
jgi:2',3'-cyclic-nucleotide 2'-phosphodiesterase (5'-nucleotidase family)